MPEEKIISRYDKALKLIPELLKVCDICSIYDNSAEMPFRIFKKRKEKCYYDDGCPFWSDKDIEALTGVKEVEYLNLNK